jgi:ADP-ribosylglycohydrolase
LLGGAVGDALGAPAEFMPLGAIRAQFGPAGITDFAPAYGRLGAFTDDTQMSLFTAEGLIRAAVREQLKGICSSSAVIHHAYLRWLLTQGERSSALQGEADGWLVHHEELWAVRAPGNTCLNALRAATFFGQAAQNMSKGCGSIMRVAPIGAVYNSGAAYGLGSAVSALTHGHPTARIAGAYFAELLAEVASGAELTDAVERARRPTDTEHYADETLTAIDRAMALARSSEAPTAELVETLGAGWTADEALSIALYCALVARDFEHGVLLAINHSGDSDSTGALVGNLLGMKWGACAIPARWQAKVQLRDVIEEIASDLFSAYVQPFDAEAASAKYPGW